MRGLGVGVVGAVLTMIAISGAPDRARADPAPQTPAAAAPVGAKDPDEAVVQAGWAAVKAGGIVGLKPQIDALQQVLAHRPEPFFKSEVRDGVQYYRADNQSDCLAFLVTAAKADKGKSASGASENRDAQADKPTKEKAVCLTNPYPSAGFLLGLYYNEVGQSEQALAALDQGLKADPKAILLITERGAALTALHRWPEALADYETGLAVDNISDRDRARLYRGRGMAMTELQRLDEAEAAYQASLKLEPGNALALHELSYIAHLRAGAAAAPTAINLGQPTNPK